MSDTPRLSAEQRYEAEALLERILGDEDEARHFVFETLYVRAKLENELAEAKKDSARLDFLITLLTAYAREFQGGDGRAVIDTAMKEGER